ncbi:MAG: hypothetical protein EU529_09895 [Promethearchaeota archaeon]|nr:MAG: hypothetical protein EU529_09895 [Candidatus Lokiarchaeota archaeon]
MNDDRLTQIIFNFLNRKEEFLQFLPKTNNNLFTIIDILNFFQNFGLPTINTDDFYKIVLSMVEKKYIGKKGDKFSLITKNVDNYLENAHIKYTNELLVENQEQEDSKRKIKENALPILVKSQKEQEVSNRKIKENALLILKNKEKEYTFVSSEIFKKSRKLIEEFNEMGNFPKIIAFVAFYQANRILNKKYHKNNRIFNLSNKDHVLIRYWNEKFESKYFDNLFDLDKCKSILDRIKEIGLYTLTDDFRKLVLSLLDSSIKRRFGLNVRLTLGLIILLAANINDIPIKDRNVSEVLQIDTGELIINSFKLIKRPIQYDIEKFYKKNPRFTDFINSNLIRFGDHLTFDLDNPEEDAEILNYTHLKYYDKELSRKDWAYKVKNIKNCNFISNIFIFHRETGLSLKSLSELIRL